MASGLHAQALWRAAINRSGFFGKYGAAAIYSSTENHEFELGLGAYPIGSTNYGQLNLAYRYGFWHIPWNERLWTPLQFGAFFIYSLDGYHFFNESPSKYPSPGYYDETRYRYGAEIGSNLAFLYSGIEVGYRLRIIDTGFVAIYNNAHRDLQYYVSSGLELRYRF